MKLLEDFLVAELNEKPSACAHCLSFILESGEDLFPQASSTVLSSSSKEGQNIHAKEEDLRDIVKTTLSSCLSDHLCWLVLSQFDTN